jgi:hypothetical protein
MTDHTKDLIRLVCINGLWHVRITGVTSEHCLCVVAPLSFDANGGVSEYGTIERKLLASISEDFCGECFRIVNES